MSAPEHEPDRDRGADRRPDVDRPTLDPVLFDGLREALRQYPDSVDLTVGVVSLLLAAGSVHDAVEVSRKALTHMPEEPRLHELLTMCRSPEATGEVVARFEPDASTGDDPLAITLTVLGCATRLCQSVPDAFAPITGSRVISQGTEITDIGDRTALTRWVMQRLTTRLGRAEEAKDDPCGRILARSLMGLMGEVRRVVARLNARSAYGGAELPFDDTDVVRALAAAFRVGPSSAMTAAASLDVVWEHDGWNGGFEPFSRPWPDALSAFVTRLVVGFEKEAVAPGAWRRGACLATLEVLVHLVDRFGSPDMDRRDFDAAYDKWDDDSLLFDVLRLSTDADAEWEGRHVRGVSTTEDAFDLVWNMADHSGRELELGDGYDSVRLDLLLHGPHGVPTAPSRVPSGFEVPLVDAADLRNALATAVPTFRDGRSFLVFRAEQLGHDQPFRGELGFWSPPDLSDREPRSDLRAFPRDVIEIASTSASRVQLNVPPFFTLVPPCTRPARDRGPAGLPDLPAMIAGFSRRGMAVEWLRAAGTFGMRGLDLRLEVGVRDTRGLATSARLQWTEDWLDGDLILVRTTPQLSADLHDLLDGGEAPGALLPADREAGDLQRARVLRLADISPSRRRQAEPQQATDPSVRSTGESLRQVLLEAGQLQADTALVILDEDRMTRRASYERLSRMWPHPDRS